MTRSLAVGVPWVYTDFNLRPERMILMCKKMTILLALLAAAAMLSSCMTPAPTAAPTAAPATAAPMATSAPTATPTAAPTAAPTATASSLVREDTPIASPTDARDAHIVSIKDRADGQLDITFDFVDWLGGNDAKTQYLLDHPGATDADMEDAGLLEVGYIRDVSHTPFTYHTGAATKFLLPTADNIALNATVTLSQFKARMAAALAGGDEGYINFVHITVDGDTLTSIAFNYTP